MAVQDSSKLPPMAGGMKPIKWASLSYDGKQQYERETAEKRNSS